MGSSCFSQGNGKNLPRIQQFLKTHDLHTRIALKGCRCGGCCTTGPNIWVDGQPMPNMTTATFDTFLKSLLPESTDTADRVPSTP